MSDENARAENTSENWKRKQLVRLDSPESTRGRSPAAGRSSSYFKVAASSVANTNTEVSRNDAVNNTVRVQHWPLRRVIFRLSHSLTYPHLSAPADRSSSRRDHAVSRSHLLDSPDVRSRGGGRRRRFGAPEDFRAAEKHADVPPRAIRTVGAFHARISARSASETPSTRRRFRTIAVSTSRSDGAPCVVLTRASREKHTVHGGCPPSEWRGAHVCVVVITLIHLEPRDNFDRWRRAGREGQPHAVRQSVARATCFERTVRPPHRPILYCYAVRCFERPLRNRGDISRARAEVTARARARQFEAAVQPPLRHVSRSTRAYSRLPRVSRVLADPPVDFIHGTRGGGAFRFVPRIRARGVPIAVRRTYGFIIALFGKTTRVSGIRMRAMEK